MRHLGSLVLSLVLGALVFAMISLSNAKGFALQDYDKHTWVPMTLAVVEIVVAGVAYAPMLLTRMSPLGPVVVGLIYGAMALWLLIYPNNYYNTFGGRSFGVSMFWENPVVTPILGFAAVPLVATLFSPRKWRRWATAPVAVAGQGYPPPMGAEFPASGAPTFPPPTFPSSGAPAFPSSGAPVSPGFGTPAPTPAGGAGEAPYPPAPTPAYGAPGAPYPGSPTYPAPGSYAAPGSPVGFPPPPEPYSGDDAETTRRL